MFIVLGISALYIIEKIVIPFPLLDWTTGILIVLGFLVLWSAIMGIYSSSIHDIHDFTGKTTCIMCFLPYSTCLMMITLTILGQLFWIFWNLDNLLYKTFSSKKNYDIKTKRAESLECCGFDVLELPCQSNLSCKFVLQYIMKEFLIHCFFVLGSLLTFQFLLLIATCYSRMMVYKHHVHYGLVNSPSYKTKVLVDKLPEWI
jgi:hypothetical protein